MEELDSEESELVVEHAMRALKYVIDNVPENKKYYTPNLVMNIVTAMNVILAKNIFQKEYWEQFAEAFCKRFKQNFEEKK